MKFWKIRLPIFIFLSIISGILAAAISSGIGQMISCFVFALVIATIDEIILYQLKKKESQNARAQN